MSRDPFRNYDAWLEAPIQREYEQQEQEVEAWMEFCEERNGPETTTAMTILGPIKMPPRTPVVPLEADDPKHPDHAIYVAWAALEAAINRRFDRLQYEDWLDQQQPDEDIWRGER